MSKIPALQSHSTSETLTRTETHEETAPNKTITSFCSAGEWCLPELDKAEKPHFEANSHLRKGWIVLSGLIIVFRWGDLCPFPPLGFRRAQVSFPGHAGAPQCPPAMLFKGETGQEPINIQCNKWCESLESWCTQSTLQLVSEKACGLTDV